MTLRKLLAYWWNWPWAPVVGLVLFTFLPFWTALPVYLAASVWSIVGFALWWRTESLPKRLGADSLMGQRATVVGASGTTGTAYMRGEYWRVQSHDPLTPGDRVRVVNVHKATLIVEREPGTSADAHPQRRRRQHR